jgi:hypothetical protein
MAVASEGETTDSSPALSTEEWRPGQELAEENMQTVNAGDGAAGAESAREEDDREADKGAEEFRREWERHVMQETSSAPELQESSSGLRQAIERILQERPLLGTVPDGFRHAAALARAEAKAAALPQLEARISALTQENQRLAGLTSITGSGPTRQGTGSGNNELSEGELRRLASDFDAGGITTETG